MLLTNLAGHLGQWTASIFNAYSSPLSHWSCQSTQAVSSCHTPATTQMYSDTDYANLYLVSSLRPRTSPPPPIPALGACYYIEVEIRGLDERNQVECRFFFSYLICRDLKILAFFFFFFTLHDICHIKGEGWMKKRALMLKHVLWIFAGCKKGIKSENKVWIWACCGQNTEILYIPTWNLDFTVVCRSTESFLQRGIFSPCQFFNLKG